MRYNIFLLTLLLVSLFLLASTNVVAQDSPGLPAPHDDVEKAFKAQKHYSPYAGRNFPTAVYWGDTHLHTGMSMDAGAFGARLTPEDAYRFALGEELTSSTGLQVKLSRPLDFLVVADHSDNMGFFPRLYSADPELLADPTGKRWYQMIQEGGQTAVQVAVEIIEGFSQGTFPKALESPFRFVPPDDAESWMEGELVATRPEHTIGVIYHLERVEGKWLVRQTLIEGEIPAWEEVSPQEGQG